MPEILGRDENGKLIISASAKELAQMREFKAKHFPNSKSQTCRLCARQLNKFTRLPAIETNVIDSITGKKKKKYLPFCKYGCYDEVMKSRKQQMILAARTLSEIPRSILENNYQIPPSGIPNESLAQEMESRKKELPKIALTEQEKQEYKDYIAWKNRNVKIVKPANEKSEEENK